MFINAGYIENCVLQAGDNRELYILQIRDT